MHVRMYQAPCISPPLSLCLAPHTVLLRFELTNDHSKALFLDSRVKGIIASGGVFLRDIALEYLGGKPPFVVNILVPGFLMSVVLLLFVLRGIAWPAAFESWAGPVAEKLHAREGVQSALQLSSACWLALRFRRSSHVSLATDR